MGTETQKSLEDLLLKTISEQHIQIRHCETISISLLVFSVAGLTGFATTALNHVELTLNAIRALAVAFYFIGALNLLLSIGLGWSHRVSTARARKLLKLYMQVNTTAQSYLPQKAKHNIFEVEAGLVFSPPVLLFLTSCAFATIGLLLTLTPDIKSPIKIHIVN